MWDIWVSIDPANNDVNDSSTVNQKELGGGERGREEERRGRNREGGEKSCILWGEREVKGGEEVEGGKRKEGETKGERKSEKEKIRGRKRDQERKRVRMRSEKDEI